MLRKTRLGHDDALDAFGGHGIGGATGALARGLLTRATLDGGHGGGLDRLRETG